MSNGSGTPLDPPPGYDMQIATTCSFMVNVVCDMCEQWLSDGKPSAKNFAWKPQDSCPVTNTVFNVADYVFSYPLWSSFTPVKEKVSEPFAIVAYARADPSTHYLAFRGSQTPDDFAMDANTAFADYTPPTNTPTTGIQVAQGFYDVFTGFDQTNVAEALSRVATAGAQLIVTGHSLGSALATLAVPQIIANSIVSANILQYNQASPMVGNSNFQTYYENLQVPTFRLVNTNDSVTTYPGGAYEHVGLPATFGADYLHEKQRHNPCCSYSYALFNPTAPYNQGIVPCMSISNPEVRIP